MHYFRKTFGLTSFLLIVSAIFAGSAVQAQNKNQIAKECIEAIKAGDTEKAKQLSVEMMDWQTLFATKTIGNAEQCLQTATGEFWKYFTTKGRFLSGEAALAEQEFIDGASKRKTVKEETQKRLICEVTVARHQVDKLEAEYENIQKARAAETLRATIETCIGLYETDQASALLEPVCNNVFMQVGVPNTRHEFDFMKLEEAKLTLALTSLRGWRSSNANPALNGEIESEVTRCIAYLAK